MKLMILKLSDCGNVMLSTSYFPNLFRGKRVQRPNKKVQYDEDDPEAYKSMPVPDKVRVLLVQVICSV